MLSEFNSEHWLDADGNPAGGVSDARGITVSWQNGPLGRDDERREPNGAFVETLIAMTKDRLEFYQTACDGKFWCEENRDAIDDLNNALYVLNRRTEAREARRVEGTHEA